MSSTLTSALLITGLGMGLVFVGILLLWGMMILLVRFIKDPKEAVETAAIPSDISPEVPDTAQPVHKKRALAAAVAVAMLMRQSTASSQAEGSATVSPWQAVLRAGNMSQRVQMFNRKNRGR